MVKFVSNDERISMKLSRSLFPEMDLIKFSVMWIDACHFLNLFIIWNWEYT